MRYVIMNNYDYSRARKRIELVTAFFVMATAIIKFVRAAYELVGVAFNYQYRFSSCTLPL